MAKNFKLVDVDLRMCSIPPDTIVHENRVFPMGSVPALWHLPLTVFKPIWDNGITGKGVKIAINDTGVGPHANLPSPIAAKNFTSSSGGGNVDRNGHATHCAGTALGRDGLGVAPEASLISAKVLSDQGSGATTWINAGRVWSAEQGADIISESLGGSGGESADEVAINNAYKAGASICVAAAGNSGYKGNNSIGYPGRYLTTCCVGAYRSDGSIATFSSGGREIDVATPGQDIVSSSYKGGYVSMSGTSMATPMFAGLMALIIHKRRITGFPDIKGMDAWREFFQINGFMKDMGDPGKDVRFGYGVPMISNILSWLREPLNI